VLGIARIAGRLLWANPGRLIVLAAGAISVALATSGMVLAASTSLAVARQTVDAGWRGTYDLLVRPADAPTLSVDGHDVVPLDYLGLRTSGITREQWQHIAQLQNVEVAAPVAALGWLKNSSPNVAVELEELGPGVVYHVEVRARIAGRHSGRHRTAGRDRITHADRWRQRAPRGSLCSAPPERHCSGTRWSAQFNRTGRWFLGN